LKYAEGIEGPPKPLASIFRSISHFLTVKPHYAQLVGTEKHAFIWQISFYTGTYDHCRLS
jgi:hypothetical protein